MAAVKQRVRSRKILNSYNGGNLQGNVVAWFYDRWWMKECGGKPAQRSR
jgi:hypothetical protein